MKKGYFALLVGLIFLWGCEPKPNQNDLLKKLVVTTDYDNTVDFTKYSSYELSIDTLSYFNNSDNNPADTLVVAQSSGDYIDAITTEVNNKMIAAGYTKKFKNQSPDLKVYIFIVDTYSTYQSLSYNPYGYGYGYGFGYGYSYGGYYPTVSVSEQADFYIEIFDLTGSGKPKLIWYCDIGDLVYSLTTLDPTTVVPYIDQAFKQSSYIHK